MKTKPASSLAKQWTHGISVEVSDAGVLLKPKPKPRRSWPQAFKISTPADELASVRGVQNRFDRDDWQW